MSGVSSLFWEQGVEMETDFMGERWVVEAELVDGDGVAEVEVCFWDGFEVLLMFFW